MPTISVIILTKNEARNIRDCLQSVAFANEIIVVDSGSTDNTVALCREYTNKILVTHDWPGDGPQKLRGLERATGEWILCIDADERVTKELAQEIQTTLAHTQKNGFYIPFHSYFCGKRIRFGDWHGESHLRLFRKNKGRIEPSIIHCATHVKGPTATLRHPILHYSYLNLSTVLQKLDRYSTDTAKQKHLQGEKASLFTALLHGTFAFIRGYILRAGFLDGKEGLMLAIYNAEMSYYRYLKLSYLQKTL